MTNSYDLFRSDSNNSDDLGHTTNAIAPVFMEATISTAAGQMISLGTLNMIAISSHRATWPVTSLSRVKPKGFTLGHRMVAGTMVFSVFQHSAFMSLTAPMSTPVGFGDRINQQNQQNATFSFFNTPPDELPRFDVHMVYVTPQNIVCYEGLRGVKIVDEGSVRSIDLPAIQESYSFMAMERIPLQRIVDINSAPLYTVSALATNVYTQSLNNALSVINNLIPRAQNA